jgi:hypothetical protein
MELSLLRKTSKWVSRTNDIGRDHLRHVRLSCIVHYGQVKLNLPLIRAASDLWDHTRHVFHFNRCELCPMMEEFGAIMGISNFDQILLPPTHSDPILLLDEVLSIPCRLGSSWSMNDGLVVTVLASFFLTGDFSETNIVVLDAIGRIDKKNPIPMIL